MSATMPKLRHFIDKVARYESNMYATISKRSQSVLTHCRANDENYKTGLVLLAYTVIIILIMGGYCG